MTRNEMFEIFREDILAGHGTDYSTGRNLSIELHERGEELNWSIDQWNQFCRGRINRSELLAGKAFQDSIFRAAEKMNTTRRMA